MELLIIIVLLVIAAETSYLVATSLYKSRKTALAPVFVDTSVLIDGRVIAIAESGFFTRPLYIPRSVVGELQFLADNADAEKRTRARHGLDIINQLQSIVAVKVVIFPDGVKADEGVDNRLLSLAKKHSGSLCTIDYNLNKVAVVEGIEVLNVNELAKSLRMAYLPGEHARIELTQKGNDQHQAVGHLEDGTMVVVEHAYKYIGTIVEVEFIRSLQTAAGKMMFARLVQTPQQKRKAETATSATEQKKLSTKPKGTAPVIQKVAKQASASLLNRQKTQRTEERKNQTSRTSQAANQATEKKPAGRPSRQSRRPRNPEDSLVELANRQQ